MLLVGAMLALAGTADGSTLLRRHRAGGAYEALAELSSETGAASEEAPENKAVGSGSAANPFALGAPLAAIVSGDEDVESGTAKPG